MAGGCVRYAVFLSGGAVLIAVIVSSIIAREWRKGSHPYIAKTTERAAAPVWFEDGNKEHVYIRNRPSSDELPVSKAMNCIRNRK